MSGCQCINPDAQLSLETTVVLLAVAFVGFMVIAGLTYLLCRVLGLETPMPPDPDDRDEDDLERETEVDLAA